MDKIKNFNPIYTLDKELTFNESERSITHYISSEAVNRYGYILKNSGMDDSKYNGTVLWEHNRDSFFGIAKPSDLVIGKSLYRKNDGYGILAKTQFSKTDLADDVMYANKSGDLNSWSLSWDSRNVKDEDIEMVGKTMCVNKWGLLEYSSVVIPANPDCINQMLGYSKSLIFKSLLSGESVINELKKSLKENADKIELLESKILTLESLSVPEQKDYSIEIKNSITELKNQFNSQLFEIVGRMQGLNDNITKNILSQVPAIVTGAIRKYIGKVD
jgi:hypothetical protein